MTLVFTHDPTALCASLINEQKKEIYIFDEAYQVGLITKDVAKMIQDKGYAKSHIIADSAEPRLIKELQTEYNILRLRESRKGKDSIMAGVSKLQGYSILCIHLVRTSWMNFTVIAINKTKRVTG